MSDAAPTPSAPIVAAPAIGAKVRAGLPRRRRAERRFRFYGLMSILVAVGILGLLLASIVAKGSGAFVRSEIALEIAFDATVIDPAGSRDPAVLARADYAGLIKAALQSRFPEATSRQDRRALNALVSGAAAFRLRDRVLANPGLIGTAERIWLPAASDIDMLRKGALPRTQGGGEGRLNTAQLAWFDALDGEGRVRSSFNTTLFTAGDSREPEQAGLLGALVGTVATMLVTLVLSLPLGVAAAVFLEEFAPKNRWTDLIEVNVNNLAAVPSIVFGLLGLAIFLGLMHLPRSAPLVGGIVLALLTLPTFIIVSRSALAAVPPSIREGALAMGASPLQVTLHHVLPLALPGILTGAIIGMARAAGESAPLLMIGMVAFIADVPRAITDPATVLPVQVYLWADSPERGFVERTSAAILVLLAFLVVINLAAVLLRRRFERRW
jgi:phosphate transport system permease protein